MTQPSIHQGFNTYQISSADGSTTAVFVPQRGGAMASLVMPGLQGPRELLYQHDFFWDQDIPDLAGAWPFCFPVCARIERQGQVGAYLYDGKVYHLDIHGFAWQLAWQVNDCTNNKIILELTDNALTRQQYPFQFRVILSYELHRGQLLCHQTYENCGDKPMPYNAGFHPYFLTPPVNQGKSEVTLNYHPIRRLQYNQSLTDIIGEQPLFSTPTSITNAEINEQLTVLGEQKLATLSYPDGDVIHMQAEGVEDSDLFPYLQLYTMAEKPFFCVEPWMGFPNAINTLHGMRWLKPGESEQGVLKLWLDHH